MRKRGAVIDPGTCQGCRGPAVWLYSDGGGWCADCDRAYNEPSGTCDCPGCLTVGRFMIGEAS
ncbi:MAG: hypothetical protein ABR532_01565 [Candidatus Dormibacteria bacterium]